MKDKIEHYFEISKNKSILITEIFAGLASFLATAYILTVNPNNILISGASDPRWASVFIATALGASIGSLLMALFAKMPLVQAPGMGVNALVGAIIGGSTGLAYSLGNALFLIFISGLIFLIFSYIRVVKIKFRCEKKYLMEYLLLFVILFLLELGYLLL